MFILTFTHVFSYSHIFFKMIQIQNTITRCSPYEALIIVHVLLKPSTKSKPFIETIFGQMVMHARACNLMQWKLNNKYWLILKINRCIEYWENATEPSQKYRNFYKSLKLRRVDFYILMANKVFTLGESFKQVHQNKNML